MRLGPTAMSTPIRIEPHQFGGSLRFCVLALLATVATSCTRREVATRAASDLECPRSDLHIESLAGSRYRVSGCNQEAVYDCSGREHSGCVADSGLSSLSSRILAPSDAEAMASGPPRHDFPASPAGFSFGVDDESARTSCEGSGHHWSITDGVRSCDGPAASVGFPATVQLRFCDSRVCRIDVSATTTDVMGRWTALRQTLERRYGPPTRDLSVIPDVCAAQVDPCVATGQAALHLSWRWSTKHSLDLLSLLPGQKPAVVLSYRAPELQGQLPTKPEPAL